MPCRGQPERHPGVGPLTRIPMSCATWVQGDVSDQHCRQRAMTMMLTRTSPPAPGPGHHADDIADWRGQRCRDRDRDRHYSLFCRGFYQAAGTRRTDQ
eukprot:1811951-Rhodomonas_salina.3